MPTIHTIVGRRRQHGFSDAVLYLIVALVAVALVLLTAAIAAATCHAQWRHSGFATSWGPLQQCLVYVGGRWLPSDRVREIDLRPEPPRGATPSEIPR